MDFDSLDFFQQTDFGPSMALDNSGAGGSGQAPSDPQPAKGSSHQRNYQACIPCRNKKVKCDRGDVDNPDPPPCARCRREGTTCTFSSTRRKTKATGDETDVDDTDKMPSDASASRKRSSSAVLTPSERSRIQHAFFPPRTPGGGAAQMLPLARSGEREPTAEEEEEEKIKTEETNQILREREAIEPRDMVKAFLDTKELSAKHHVADTAEYQPDEDRVSRAQALDAWRSFKFVAEGLLSEVECINYVRYFYEHLAPLTAVAIPDFNSDKLHKALVQEEPVLCMTMLAIASRYQKLMGRGAELRSANVHTQLSSHLERMINALVWGHEFNHNVPRRSTLPTSPDATTKSGSLRSLGTIESLVMLSEWHSRTLHFPAHSGLERLCFDDATRDTSSIGSNGSNGSNNIAFSLQNPSLQVKDDCQDPCLRSDRICWSMLNLAKALAYELEIMDHGAKFTRVLQRRAENTRRLIFVYLTQTAGRLSIPMPFALEDWESLFSADRMEEKVKPLLMLDDPSQRTDKEMQQLRQDATLFFWSRLAGLFYHGNKALFASHTLTHTVIQNNLYPVILEQLNEMHEAWLVSLDQCTLIHPNMRLIFDIEYQYMRVLGYNVALQAVVLRCVHPANSENEQAFRPQTLSRHLGNDRKHIDQIIASSQALLRSVVELGKTGALQHAPVRTFFRIIAVAVILLKTFSLGVDEVDGSKSLGLLDDAAGALSVNVIDDIHIAGFFASHIFKLTERVRKRMVRINQGSTAVSSARSASSASPTKRRRTALASHHMREGSNTISERRGGPTFGLSDSPVAPPRQAPQGVAQRPLGGSDLKQQQQSGQTPRATDYFNMQHQPYGGASCYTPGGMDPLRNIQPASHYDPLDPEMSIFPPKGWSYNYGQMPSPSSQQMQGGSSNNTYDASSSSMQERAAAPSVRPQPPTYSGDAANDEPSSNATGAHDSATAAADSTSFGSMPSVSTPSSWLALPVDRAINAGADAEVNSYGFGPDFGQRGDYLDVLLEDEPGSSEQSQPNQFMQ